MPKNHQSLYLVVLGLLVPVAILALGGGIFGQGGPFNGQWQHQIFSSLCHQIPDRSFWINGQPMAVCSRCFGIYAGLASIWVLIPFIPYSRRGSTRIMKILLSVIVAVNVVDVAANLMGIWSNTLLSRMILGLMLSGAVVILIGSSMKKADQKSQQTYKKQLWIII